MEKDYNYIPHDEMLRIKQINFYGKFGLSESVAILARPIIMKSIFIRSE